MLAFLRTTQPDSSTLDDDHSGVRAPSALVPLEHEPVPTAPRTVTELLADVASQGPDATGALAFGTPHRLVGTVLLERGRVCWATVAGMGERLRALVAEVASVPQARPRVDALFRVCLRDNKPLGETLIASGVVTESSLRAVLKRQMAEALLVMAGEARPLGWIPRHSRSYDPRFSFSAADMIVAAAAVTAPHLSAIAAEELSDILGASGPGITFARSAESDEPSPVCLTGAVDLSVREVLALGRWSTDALASAPGASYVCARIDRSAAVIAWSSPPFLHVALCTEPSGIGWVISRLERRRRDQTPPATLRCQP